MVGYLSAVWRCRYFLMSLVRMDLRTRYRGSVLGLGWSLLHPIAMTATLCLVFRHLFQMNARDFAPFLLAGLSCWNYITATTLQGCRCFFQGESYIRQYPAPLAIYPLRTALGGMIHFLLALLVVLMLRLVVYGLPDPLAFLSLLPSLLMLFLLGWGMAVIAGFLNVYFQDTQHLAEIGFQILFYATPIIYKPELLLQRQYLQWLVILNPFVSFLELIRAPLLDGSHVPSMQAYIIASATVAFVLGLAGLLLYHCQRRLIFYL
ncbi:MAG: ABC transporter permease [Gemmataceae bacterium]